MDNLAQLAKAVAQAVNTKPVRLFLQEAVQTLRHSKTFAEDYVRLKTEFFHTYQGNMVFSTRFGADFFSETLMYIECDWRLKADASGILGEFDKNFNRWLDRLAK